MANFKMALSALSLDNSGIHAVLESGDLPFRTCEVNGSSELSAQRGSYLRPTAASASSKGSLRAFIPTRVDTDNYGIPFLIRMIAD